MTKHSTFASSFADPDDLKAFNECKAKGMSDQEAFKYGDNAIGCWGAATHEGTGPACALPPDYMEEEHGSVKAAKHRKVHVAHANGKEVVCVLKDRMPRLENIKSKARIDLNPDAVAALGFKPPILEPVTWWWEEDET